MTTKSLSIPGFSIAYQTWGSRSNPPVLALHGWLDNSNSFASIAHYLQDEYYLIAVDLPGHGLSSHVPEGMHYHFIDSLYTVVRIIEALEHPKVHLLGHSLGACIASIVAAIAPHYLLSLSLIEGLGPLTSSEESCYAQLKQFLTKLDIKSLHTKKYPTLDKAAQIRAAKGYVSLEIAKLLCDRGMKEEGGTFSWRHDQRLLYPSSLRMTEEQVLSCLKEVTAKTLLILANEGFSFSDEEMACRVKAIRHLRVEHLTGGHHIHMEQPQTVASLLATFYGR